MKKIILTGGGTAGHVMPNIALIPGLKKLGYDIIYIGSKNGIEKDIIKKEGIKYFGISSGKLRRYVDLKNLSDPFKVIKGILDAYVIIKKEKPNIVFSKGGFVSVPVVMAAHMNKVPVIAHESDMTPGLANRISAPYCTKICVTFPESLAGIKEGKGILTGTPIRTGILNGDPCEGKKICGFADEKPVILVMGGSQGSRIINENLRSCIYELLKTYNVIHICGKNNVDESLSKLGGYKQFEFAGDNLKHLFAAADLIVSRAGANSIFEILALKKPNLLIPLSKRSSRGDQILNAKSFERSGYSMVLKEEELTGDILMEKINELFNQREKYINNMKNSPMQSGTEKIINLIDIYSK